jgi:hypothetical protein
MPGETDSVPKGSEFDQAVCVIQQRLRSELPRPDDRTICESGASGSVVAHTTAQPWQRKHNEGRRAHAGGCEASRKPAHRTGSRFGMLIIKGLLAAFSATAGLSLAQAQQPPARNDIAPMQAPMASAPHSDEQTRNGDNIGSSSTLDAKPLKPDVKHDCVGPVSYCNLYSGS